MRARLRVSPGVLLCISESGGWSWTPSTLIGESQSILFPGRLRRRLEQEENAHDKQTKVTRSAE